MAVGDSVPAGAAKCIEALQHISIEDVVEDQQAEIESMESAADFDEQQENDSSYVRASNISIKKQKLSQADLERNVEKASESVIVAGTLSEYRQLWAAFNTFCLEHGLVKPCKNLDEFWRKLPPQLPVWIVTWIMNKADDMDVVTGNNKDPSIPRVTYARAQKMRAAVSHKFNREFKLGTQVWTENPLSPGTFAGNPSLSVVVSQYMISLRRRKVRAGEVVTSARAIDEATMKKLWEFNDSFPVAAEIQSNSRKRKLDSPENWGGYKLRQMLQTLYIVSMLCLLRYDEALRIEWSDVYFEEINGVRVVRLELPFRKTNQTGGIAPFVLWPNKEKPWLDPVLALAKWWTLCGAMGIDMTKGFVFRSRCYLDEVSYNGNDQMSTDGFIECFRNNMVDIDVDPRPYGTHSFRRGGCQYLAMTLRWPIRTICTWGGWAENFDNPGTIFRYLLSWVDTPLVDRQDYFNPNRLGTDPCAACGRTCHCA